ncbi:unnamed protein product [Sympodiomycopsis kandeliae]
MLEILESRRGAEVRCKTTKKISRGTNFIFAAQICNTQDQESLHAPCERVHEPRGSVNLGNDPVRSHTIPSYCIVSYEVGTQGALRLANSADRIWISRTALAKEASRAVCKSRARLLNEIDPKSWGNGVRLIAKKIIQWNPH